MSNNNDTTRSRQNADDESTFASVKPNDGSGYTTLESKDDLYPKRVKRLKDYLADTTSANSSNPDVTYSGTKNKYPIDSGDGPNTNTFEQEQALREAFESFNTLSFGTSFEGKISSLEKGIYNSSNTSDSFISNNPEKTNDIVKTSLDPNRSQQSRWFGVTREIDYQKINKDLISNSNTYLSAARDNFLIKNKNMNLGLSNTKEITPSSEVAISGSTIGIDVDHRNLQFLDDPQARWGVDTNGSRYSTTTYGNRNTHDNPFETKINFELGDTSDNKVLAFASDLFEIFLLGIINANAGNLFQVLSFAISETQSFTKDSSPPVINRSSWENIYIDNPQLQDPTELFKGSSGYNQDSFRILLQDIDNNFSSPEMIFDKGTSIDAIISELKNAGLNEVVRAINFFSYMLRDLNISVPKATLSNLRHGEYLNPKKEGGNIVLAYNIAAAKGLLHLVSHGVIHGLLDHRNRGFFENLTVNIKKERDFYKKFISVDNLLVEDVRHWLGDSYKIVRFFNYLVNLGDIVALSDPKSHVKYSASKVPLDTLENSPTTRLAKYRKKGIRKSTLSLSELPSQYLILQDDQKNVALGRMSEIGNKSYFGSQNSDKSNEEGKSSKFSGITGNRFSREQVIALENQLEAEQMPFYIQDLRTNEIIAFHAFLGDLSDSYSATWAAQQGFGRLEAAQIYGGGSRAIGLSFTMVAFNETDFDEMWWKINKLTTLVYPQWSRGTLMEDSEGKSFVQPFSQVPTASPLARVRVGDIFTSNYSKQNVARLFGMFENDASKFEYTPSTDIKRRKLNTRGLRIFSEIQNSNLGLDSSNVKILDSEITVNYDSLHKTINAKGVPIIRNVEVEDYLAMTEYQDSPQSEVQNGISDFFKSENNPIVKAFESTAGRGIAVAINSIQFSWKLGEYPWNTDPGSRAPRMCDVSLGMTPIHDITPGLDHNGINRAPIYGVGSYSNNLKGDPHLSTDSYNKMMHDITLEEAQNLRPPKSPHKFNANDYKE